MNGSEQSSAQREGSVIVGALLGVPTGFLTMWVPWFLVPDDDNVGWFSIGFTVLALVGCVVVSLESGSPRRTLVGFFWGVIAGAISLVLLMLWALSQIGS